MLRTRVLWSLINPSLPFGVAAIGCPASPPRSQTPDGPGCPPSRGRPHSWVNWGPVLAIAVTGVAVDLAVVLSIGDNEALATGRVRCPQVGGSRGVIPRCVGALVELSRSDEPERHDRTRSHQCPDGDLDRASGRGDLRRRGSLDPGCGRCCGSGRVRWSQSCPEGVCRGCPWRHPGGPRPGPWRDRRHGGARTRGRPTMARPHAGARPGRWRRPASAAAAGA